MRFYITGTDTDVGKTRVTAMLAYAARDVAPVTVVKLVQTGLVPGIPGDADVAAAYAGCRAIEILRYRAPADPWSAALAAGCEPPRAQSFAEALGAVEGPLLVEGSGGAAVPLNAMETVTDAALRIGCVAIIVVGLRLGCINHAILTNTFLAGCGMQVRGAILCERWAPTPPAYRDDVRRALEGHVRILGLLPHDTNAARSIGAAAPHFRQLVQG